MSYVKICTKADYNATATPVEIEVFMAEGNQSFIVIGLPETQVKESIDRVKSAIIASGFSVPNNHITINLKPATIPKKGSQFDLPIALAILIASKQIENNISDEFDVFGELGLNGEIHGNETFISLFYKTWQASRLLIFPKNLENQVKYFKDIKAKSVKNLKQATLLLKKPLQYENIKSIEIPVSIRNNSKAFEGIIGQSLTKRALSIAAAGGHHTLLIGPPGTGKSLLAHSLPEILPDLSTESAIETMCLSKQKPNKRPAFRSPHHGISTVGLVGGGSPIKAGEITRAHQGVLFTDELTEYSKQTLEMLREPVESGKISIVRMGESITLPCNFQWIAALNPCPCGMFGHPQESCRCSYSQRQQYINKLSTPIIDRFAIACKVDPIVESSSDIHFSIEQISQARAKQLRESNNCNQKLSSFKINSLKITKSAQDVLNFAAKNLSERQKQQAIKVAKTISDLNEQYEITDKHIQEALAYTPRDIISGFFN